MKSFMSWIKRYAQFKLLKNAKKAKQDKHNLQRNCRTGTF